MSDDLVTIAHFWQIYEAHVAKSVLEAEGIEAHVADENIVNMNSLLTNAVGGVRLQVGESEAERAKDILARIESDPASFPDDSDLAPTAESPPCPKCGSSDTNMDRRPMLPAVVYGVLTAGPPLPFMHRRWVCAACGHTWPADSPKHHEVTQ